MELEQPIMGGADTADSRDALARNSVANSFIAGAGALQSISHNIDEEHLQYGSWLSAA